MTFLPFWIEGVNGAAQARIERMNSAKHFQRLFRVGQGLPSGDVSYRP